MTQVPDSTEAGWYPDPTDAQMLRWWDGQGWTSHISAKLIETVPRATPTAVELRVRVRGAHAARVHDADESADGREGAAPVLEPDCTHATACDTGAIETGAIDARAIDTAATDSVAVEPRRARRPQLRPRDERAAGRAAFGDLS